VGRVGIVPAASAVALAVALERGHGRGTWIVNTPAAGAPAGKFR
jgi:hypothetical protein